MPSNTLTFNPTEFRQQLEAELTDNILPFWMTHVVDKVNGGFYGAVTNDLQILNEVPRSAVLCSRILWTFAAAYRRFGNERYLSTARWAYDYLTRVFWDQKYGGVYWQVDYQGRPVADRKHHYAQAFAIYGLSEYYRATHEPQSLELAQALFQLLEKHAYEPIYRGYIEATNRRWETLSDMRLGERDLNCRKSNNTMLHILEAYTNLVRVWNNAHLKAQHRDLIKIFLERIIDPATGHCRLFFDDEWHPLSEVVSFGHDIEASWLLAEAAQVQGDPVLFAQARQTAIKMATTAYREGLDGDGSLNYERNSTGVVDRSKAWWPQAEAMVGFYDAYQLSEDSSFAQAAHRLWQYIRNKFVDRTYGDWFKQLRPDGTPDLSRYKVGPWDCPYHQSRACLEMMERLELGS